MPKTGAREIREQVTAGSCETSRKSALKPGVVTQLEKHIPSWAGRSAGRGGGALSQADYTNIPHARFDPRAAVRGGRGEAGAGLPHGAAPAGVALLSRCGHPRCCGMRAEVVPVVSGYPVVLVPAAAGCDADQSPQQPGERVAADEIDACCESRRAPSKCRSV